MKVERVNPNRNVVGQTTVKPRAETLKLVAAHMSDNSLVAQLISRGVTHF